MVDTLEQIFRELNSFEVCLGVMIMDMWMDVGYLGTKYLPTYLSFYVPGPGQETTSLEKREQ